MTRLRAYPSYQDSGVEWIGQVPREWVVLATARVCDLTTGERDTQDAVEDGGYPFFVRSQTIERIDSYSFDGEAVMTSGDGAGVGKIFHHHVGKMEIHQRVYRFHNFRRITGRFFFYFLREHLHLVALAGNAKSTVDSLRRPMLRMFPVCLPSAGEQTCIVDFLDYETARIDALIEKQQQLIALLQEKRQAVISHAVTKGLNPDAPMRDSGVEWLGKVPAHWDVVSLKRFISTRKGAPFKSTDFTDEGVQVVRASDVKNLGLVASGVFLPPQFLNSHPRAILRTGELILTTVGSGPQVRNSAVGQIGRVSANFNGTLLNQNTVVFSVIDNRLSGDYLFQLVQVDGYRDHLDLHAHGTANQASLNVADILNFMVPIPPTAEQLAIVEFVVGMSERMFELERSAAAQIDLLSERRTALISAAATGKIDVRQCILPSTDVTTGVA